MKRRDTLNNNLISKDVLREVQLETLKIISDAVMNSAGIKGSNTMILSKEKNPVYSKDGKRILENIKFFGKLENDIVDQLVEIVQHVVREVGDGTTCATRLSYNIFYNLYETEDKLPKGTTSYDLIDAFNKVSKEIQDGILSKRRDTTIDDIYNICMISTNGNEKLSSEITSIYEKFGLDVFINVSTSNTPENIIKTYDGVTLEKGCASPAYYNTTEGSCSIRNPRIYVFNDPIDTEEMIALFTRIVYQNIIGPFNNIMQGKDDRYIPTVILAPSISRDVSNMLEEIELMLYNFDKTDVKMKPPICIVTKLNRYIDQVYDITKLCGCKPICKYIDPTVQQKDIEAGKAPTVENVCDQFYGSADLFECDTDKTKIINPKNMYERNENGNLKLDENNNPIFSSTYNGMISFLEAEIKTQINNNDDIATIAITKRRLNALKANMVDYLIGGVASIDRNADLDLVEDAVLNCRSAARDGVGYGASFMGLSTVNEKKALALTDTESEKYSKLERICLNVLFESYESLVRELYGTCLSEDEIDEYYYKSFDEMMPLNLRTKEFDGKVLSSIKSDAAILEGVSKIITIMFTANQGLYPTVIDNTYKKLDN